MRRNILYIALALLWFAGPLYARGFRTGQADITVGTAVKVGDAGARAVLTIVNHDGTNPIFCGSAAVASTTGLRLAAGVGFTISGSSQIAPPAEFDIYCVATGGTVRVSFWEDLR